MAGFKRHEPYYIAEMELDLPHSIGQLEKYLLPCIPMWRSQRTGRRGDKSEACDNFLNELIPYLVEVLCTSGIYFIRDFPSHPVSSLLTSIPGYEQWAVQARSICTHRLETRDIDRLDHMNIACRAAFETVHRRIDSIQQQQERIERKVNRILSGLNQLLTGQQEQNNTNQQRRVERTVVAAQPAQQEENDSSSTGGGGDETAEETAAETEGISDDEEEANRHMQQQHFLRNTPRIPAIQQSLPQSFREVLFEFKEKNLSHF